MIPTPRPNRDNEPAFFDSNCREPGTAWLAASPNLDPHLQSTWWRAFQPELARLFEYRCGWLASYIGLEGDVDHWVPCNVDRSLAFEWSNYRYCAGTINSLKSAHDNLLDPCEVGPGWFRVTLPDFQLIPTDQIPPQHEERARATLDTLQLRRGYYARWNRWQWYARHWNQGDVDLDSLKRDAPLVARAVELAREQGEELPIPGAEPPNEIRRRQRTWRPRQRRPGPSRSE